MVLEETKQPILNIVLFEPEIPANTGNIMRTCAATNFVLHLIEPINFYIDDAHMKRAGMDYKDKIQLVVHDDLPSFFRDTKGTYYYVSRYGHQAHSDFDYAKDDKAIFLIFGKESTGLPLDLLAKNQDTCMRIPMASDARSLNLSNSVAIVAYEVLRQLDYPNLSQEEVQKGSTWLDNFLE